MAIRVAASVAGRYVPEVRPRLGMALMLGLGAACGDPSWQEVVDDYATTVCNGLASCGVPGDPAACAAELRADLADTRTRLTSEQEQSCMACMQTVTDVLPDVVDNGCASTPAQDDRIYASCDLDPSVDYDSDGDPGNDDQQACDG